MALSNGVLMHLPTDVWIVIIIEMLGFEYDNCKKLRLLSRQWCQMISSSAFSSQCTMYFDHHRLIRLCRNINILNVKEKLIKNSSLYPYSHNVQTNISTAKTTEKNASQTFVKTIEEISRTDHLPGILCIETVIATRPQENALRSDVALSTVAQILSKASGCTKLLWHDNSIARHSRLLFYELRRRLPRKISDGIHAQLLVPKSPLISKNAFGKSTEPPLHLTSCHWPQATEYFYPSACDERRQQQRSIIFPCNLRRQRSCCFCGLMFLSKALHASWTTFSKVLSESKTILDLSLRGLIFEECFSLFHIYKLKLPFKRLKLKYLECPTTLFPLFRFDSLQILHGNGALSSIDVVMTSLSEARNTLTRLTLHINPSTHTRQLTTNWRQTRHLTNDVICQIGALDSELTSGRTKATPTLECPYLKDLRLIWAAEGSEFAEFVNKLSFPSLETCYIEITCKSSQLNNDSGLVKQRSFRAFHEFIARSGGTAGTLKCLSIQSKWFDDYLLSDLSRWPPSCSQKSFTRLELLRSSALYFNFLFTNKVECQKLRMWDCWRVPYTRETSSSTLSAALLALNTMPTVNYICLPSTTADVSRLEHVTHLRLTEDFHMPQSYDNSGNSAIFENLKLDGRCEVETLIKLIDMSARRLKSLFLSGFIEGSIEEWGRVFEACPQLQLLQIDHKEILQKLLQKHSEKVRKCTSAHENFFDSEEVWLIECWRDQSQRSFFKPPGRKRYSLCSISSRETSN